MSDSFFPVNHSSMKVAFDSRAGPTSRKSNACVALLAALWSWKTANPPLNTNNRVRCIKTIVLVTSKAGWNVLAIEHSLRDQNLVHRWLVTMTNERHYTACVEKNACDFRLVRSTRRRWSQAQGCERQVETGKNENTTACCFHSHVYL